MNWRRSLSAKVDGPTVVLPPEYAQNFTLVIHEMATNSAKHGALSSSAGNITVSWEIEPATSGSRLMFRWQESGGPAVAPPAHQGFGTQLIKAAFPHARIEYRVEGLTCEIDLALANEPRSANADALVFTQEAANV